MAHIQLVPVETHSLTRFEPIYGREFLNEVVSRADEFSNRLGNRVIWNVNSTATGGGVAEMLRSMLGYPRDRRIDVRWAVIEGTPEFFNVTKRIHHALQGSAGDGSPLGHEQHAVYEQVLSENADELTRILRPGDVVILHDPQTAGLAPALLRHGCVVIWRSHIGYEKTNAETELGWEFLSRYLKDATVSVFSRRAYLPPFLEGARSAVVPPSIDPFSPKSEDLDEIVVRSVLEQTGLIASNSRGNGLEFVTSEGVVRHVDRRAHFATPAEPPSWEAPLVIQVSRWDPLKDPVGVIDAFTRVPTENLVERPHLMLVGPEITGVADDPEAGAVLEATLEHWNEMSSALRQRVHLVLLPSVDPVENATMVNALQSHAHVVVQKSLREGFGLTVTEAMWKGRAVVASKVGGIQDQIEDEVEGLLVSDPEDLDATAEAIARVLADPALAARLGAAARARVTTDFLPPRHLLQYASLIEENLPMSA